MRLLCRKLDKAAVGKDAVFDGLCVQGVIRHPFYLLLFIPNLDETG